MIFFFSDPEVGGKGVGHSFAEKAFAAIAAVIAAHELKGAKACCRKVGFGKEKAAGDGVDAAGNDCLRLLVG